MQDPGWFDTGQPFGDLHKTVLRLVCAGNVRALLVVLDRPITVVIKSKLQQVSTKEKICMATRYALSYGSVDVVRCLLAYRGLEGSVRLHPERGWWSIHWVPAPPYPASMSSVFNLIRGDSLLFKPCKTASDFVSVPMSVWQEGLRWTEPRRAWMEACICAYLPKAP